MNNKFENKVILGYNRVSTKEQKDFGNSLTVQKKRIENFCEVNGLKIMSSFNEDFSAKNFNRPTFQELKSFAKTNKNKIDYILVQKWDRFSRNVGKALLMIETFKRMGIEVNCVENWIDYDAPDHIVILSIYLSTPEAENSKIRERTIAGTRQALREGRYVQSHPKGYISGKNSKGKSMIQPDIKVAPLIKSLFEDYATGLYTQQDLIKKYIVKGLSLNKSVLSRLLDNPLYMGTVRLPAYKDEPEELIEGIHTPIITKDLFHIVQKVKHGKYSLTRKPRGENEIFPLTGVLKCAECGDTMCGSQTNNGKSKKVTRKYYYYQCNSKHKCLRYSPDKIHQELHKVLKTIKPSEEVLELFQQILIDEYQKTKKERLKDTQRIERSIDEISKNQMLVTEKFGLGKIKENVYYQLMDSYETQLIDLKGSKAELGDYQKDLDKYLTFGMTLLTNIDVFYKNASVEMKKKLLGSILNEKLEFFKNSFRTHPFNEAVLLLCNYNKAFKSSKIKKGGVRKNISHFVLKAGIEPALPKKLDFESSASTNSAT